MAPPRVAPSSHNAEAPSAPSAGGRAAKMLRTVSSKAVGRRADGDHAMPLVPHVNVPPSMPLSRFRAMVYEVCDNNQSSVVGAVLYFAIMFFILLSIVTFCLSTTPDIRLRQEKGERSESDDRLDSIETVVVIVFTIEYLARLLTVSAVPDPKTEGPMLTACTEAEEGLAAATAAAAKAKAQPADVSALAAGHSTPASSEESSGLEVAVMSSASGPAAETPALGTGGVLVALSAKLAAAVARLPLSYSRRSLLDPVSFAPTAASFVIKVSSFLFSPLNIIDLAAIAPYYINLGLQAVGDDSGAATGSLAILRVLRLARVVRVLRLSRRASGFRLLASTVILSIDALVMLLYIIALGVVLFGSMIFYCEAGEYDAAAETWMRPNVAGTDVEVSPFRSIPVSLWWATVTITTVGYGDLFPTTACGRTVGAAVIVSGMLALAMPITIIGANFSDEFSRYKANIRMGGDGFTPVTFKAGTPASSMGARAPVGGAAHPAKPGPRSSGTSGGGDQATAAAAAAGRRASTIQLAQEAASAAMDSMLMASGAVSASASGRAPPPLIAQAEAVKGPAHAHLQGKSSEAMNGEAADSISVPGLPIMETARALSDLADRAADGLRAAAGSRPSTAERPTAGVRAASASSAALAYSGIAEGGPAPGQVSSSLSLADRSTLMQIATAAAVAATVSVRREIEDELDALRADNIFVRSALESLLVIAGVEMGGRGHAVGGQGLETAASARNIFQSSSATAISGGGSSAQASSSSAVAASPSS